MTRQGEPHDEGYLQVAREVFASTTKPFCILSNLASAVANDEAALLRDDGIPVLEGTASGLAALRHLLAYRDGRSRPPIVAPEPVADDALTGMYTTSSAKASAMLTTSGVYPQQHLPYPLTYLLNPRHVQYRQVRISASRSTGSLVKSIPSRRGPQMSDLPTRTKSGRSHF